MNDDVFNTGLHAIIVSSIACLAGGFIMGILVYHIFALISDQRKKEISSESSE